MRSPDMWEPAEKLPITPTERAVLTQWVRAPTTARRTVTRSRIVLAAARGLSNCAISREVGMSRPTVIEWRDRFEAERLACLPKDRPRPGGGTPALSEAVARAVIERTLHHRSEGATHWSTRSMARDQGISRSAVHRIWSSRELKRHLVKTFNPSPCQMRNAARCSDGGREAALHADPQESQGVEDGALPGRVLADEDTEIVEVETHLSNAPVVPDTEAPDLHRSFPVAGNRAADSRGNLPFATECGRA